MEKDEEMKMAIYKNDKYAIQEIIKQGYDINTLSVTKKNIKKRKFFFKFLKKGGKLLK
jgi:hypothetical protein